MVADKYVTSDSGTGIVHQAPAFGEDDHRIAIKEGIVAMNQMPPCPIDEKGVFNEEVAEFLRGVYLKVRSFFFFPLSPPSILSSLIFTQDADKPTGKTLKDAGRLIIASNLIHSYTCCPR